MERKTYTVSELNALIGNLFEDSFPGPVYVEGEIGNYKKSAAGHIYFTLFDDKSLIQCVLWRSRAALLPDRMADGTGVIVRGRLNLYREGGRYSLVVDGLDVAGVGMKGLKLKELKEKLQKEGLFSSGRKRSLPFLPRTIGVVTSPSGAALRDIMKVARRRNPFVSLLLSPCIVQGEEAPSSITEALERLYTRSEVDVIIVGRGGGSKEDLSAFDDEKVVRAVASSPCPVISAVGHEIDISLTDLAADLRAETPSAAAEAAVPSFEDLKQKILKLHYALTRAILDTASFKDKTIEELSGQLFRRSPETIFNNLALRTDELALRLSRRLDHVLKEKKEIKQSIEQRMTLRAEQLFLRQQQRKETLHAHLGRVAPLMAVQQMLSRNERRAGQLQERLLFLINEKKGRLTEKRGRLQGASPLDPLQRGYVIVRQNGITMEDPGLLSPGSDVMLEWKAGEAAARITDIFFQKGE
jgi:exodeoxyribonuclease VII large subunit